MGTVQSTTLTIWVWVYYFTWEGPLAKGYFARHPTQYHTGILQSYHMKLAKTGAL